MPGFGDLEAVSTPAGQNVGSFRALAGGKVEKVAIARLVFGPGAEYNYIRVIPLPRYRTPQFVCEGMTIAGATTFSVDLYPSVDLPADPEHFARYHDLLESVYVRACEAKAFSWRPSKIAWVRSISSPYFFMSASEDQSAIQELATSYFGAWMEFHSSEPPVAPEAEAAIRRRRETAIDGLLAWDPDGDKVIQVLGKELFERLFNAMLRA